MQFSKKFHPLATFTVLACIFLSACGVRPHPNTQRRVPVTHPVIPVITPSDETSLDNNPAASMPAQVQSAAPNPAAESLITKGMQALDAGDTASAEWNFEEAIHLAPNYGPAYYWMARAKLKSLDYGKAASLAEKAESLTPQDSAWQEKIQSLKTEIDASRD